MASVANPSLAHRTVSNIRTGATGASAAAAGSGRSGAVPSTPSGPSPFRTAPSTFASPSALRAEEDTIVMEIGARKLVAGFAGDAVSRGTMMFGPEQQRRVGDLRVWQDGYRRNWRGAGAGNGWDSAYELWKLDVRHVDAGLIGDKLERALRDALTRYLMVDSRPRRMVVILPPTLPIPLLSATLDTLFGRFLTPSVSLLSAPVAAAMAAGLRSALVVDLGWAETTVTSVYEYREVACTRTIRAGRMLIQQVHDLLAGLLPHDRRPEQPRPSRDSSTHVLSFDECEDVATRLVWCKPGRPAAAVRPGDNLPTEAGLATVAETDETVEDAGSRRNNHNDNSNNNTTNKTHNRRGSRTTEIPLESCTPPATIRLAFDQLAEPCEVTFFGATSGNPGAEIHPASWDDEELPVPLLLFRHLQRLPVDVRATCMARIVFVGGCTGVLGLRGRIFDDVAGLVAEQGWDGVRGKAVAQFRENPKLKRTTRQQQLLQAAAAAAVATGSTTAHTATLSADAEWHDAASAQPEPDPVEAELQKARARSESISSSGNIRPPSAGQLRAVETLGAWSGASLLTQLRVPTLAAVDREQWTQQGGALGAVRPADVDIKTLQRQSMGPGGAAGLAMRSVTGGGASGNTGTGTATWTLGAWGTT
ncbi:actin-related protein [Grosmannia clavigera kw1407]|uniref:Actin-related protein n=1 Tax=Grosmannia clavigera (strain kw1407 / UAMH 11150) TaxID=655863 RepID=F0XA49_GROCL|nr:actin-related protein [Grosmannia clavigera kw1407]EFX05990.1 actin-related protein [Grosmannia clavigera kw1407]